MMMRNMKTENKSKRIFLKSLAVIMTAVLIVSLSGCYKTSYYDKYKSGDGRFSDLKFVMPDFNRFYELCDKIDEFKDDIFRCVSVSNYYYEAFDILNDVYAMEALAEIMTMIDVTDTYYNEACVTIKQNKVDMLDRMWKMTESLVEAPGAFMLREANDLTVLIDGFGGSYEENHNPESDEISKQIADELTRFTALTGVEFTVDAQNYTFIKEVPEDERTYTVNDDGSRSWLISQDEINLLYSGGHISADVANQMRRDLSDFRTQEIGGALVNLINLRNKFAKTKGYNSFRDYAYEKGYVRPYKNEEIEELRTFVKEVVVTLYQSIKSSIDQSQISKANSISAGIYSEDMVAGSRAVLEKVYPGFKEIIDEMLEKERINYNYSPVKMDVAFTAVFPCYDIPFIFLQPDQTASFSDINSFFHEFGHYYQFVKYPETSYSQDIDSTEVMSQSLELMASNAYGEIFTEEKVCDALYNNALSNKLSTLLNGFFIDELESLIYSKEDLTVDYICDTYYDLLLEYGLISTSMKKDDVKGYWINIFHLFEQPFYYISYGISVLVSMEIFLSEDPVSVYNMFCGNTVDCDIRANCEKCGLPDPLVKENLLKTVAKIISAKR